MQRICVLDDALINRIAAGEVVERPASAIKELIENSLDAGAKSIRLTVEGGGRSRIRIEDDGHGMSRDDAILCLERHATSKIRKMAELESIATMGFRGEALSSIAAVSHFRLETAEEDGNGTEIVVRGGRIAHVKDVGVPRGTTIQVDRLFFNVPARRKFMRGEATELSHVVRWATRYALSRPDVRFELRQRDRRLLRADPTDSMRTRIGQIYGNDFVDRLLPFGLDTEGLKVEGFAGRPVDALSRREAQHLFVNGRAVQDRVLLHAVSEAYRNATPHGKFPSLFLFIQMDPTQVDVNVHPQKTEIRFRQSSHVHDGVRDAVAAALGQVRSVPRYGELQGPRPTLDKIVRARSLESSTFQEAPSASAPASGPFSAGPAEPIQVSGGARQPFAPSPDWKPADRREGGELNEPAHRDLSAGLQVDDNRASQEFVSPREAESLFTQDSDSPPISPLAQYSESYVIAQDPDGLVIVDQHAAHERILFERFLKQADANEVPQQQLLFPITLELPAHQRVLLEAEHEEFERLGFTIEPFGGNTFRVETVPAVAARLDPEAILRDLIGVAEQARSTTSQIDSLRLKLVTTAACKAAVKFNDKLDRESMQRLLDDLFRCDNPTTCPHGRPVLFRLTQQDLERTFSRG